MAEDNDTVDETTKARDKSRKTRTQRLKKLNAAAVEREMQLQSLTAAERRSRLDAERAQRAADFQKRNKEALEKMRSPVADKMRRPSTKDENKGGVTIRRPATGIKFATGPAQSLAQSSGLVPEDFQGMPPKSKTGYTEAQVRDVVDGKQKKLATQPQTGEKGQLGGVGQPGAAIVGEPGTTGQGDSGGENKGD